MFKFFTTLPIWAFLLFSLLSPQAYSESVTLYISVVENDLDVMFHEYTRSMIEQNLPGHKVIMVQNELPISFLPKRFKTKRKIVRSQIIEQIQSLESSGRLLPTDTISHLVISTHGNTAIEKSLSYTELYYLGVIPESLITSMITRGAFNEIFDPIRTRFSKNLNIILDSCSTLCGSKDQVSRRGQALLHYFNAPDGVIMGAVANINPEMITLYNKRSFLKDAVKNVAFANKIILYTSIPLSTAMVIAGQSLGMDTLSSLYSAATIFSSLHILGTGGAIAMLEGLFPLLRTLGLLNKSKILVYESGEMVREIPLKTSLKSYFEFSSPSASCQRYFH